MKVRSMMGSQVGRVLQGYFRVEQFRGAGDRAVVTQPMSSDRRIAAPALPRPDLLPAKMRSATAQANPWREAGSAWSGVPRPDLLPGMGPAIVGEPGMGAIGTVRTAGTVTQAWSNMNNGVRTAPIPVGQLRVIGEGHPLEPGICQAMEAFFQTDFSGVRVHESPTAQAMGALAFTLGEELHFTPGLYDPKSRDGVALLGHELAHVVQQRDGQVKNPYGQGVAIVQDPMLEMEASVMGQRIADEIWSAGRDRGLKPFAGIHLSRNGGSSPLANATGRGAQTWTKIRGQSDKPMAAHVQTAIAARVQTRPAASQSGGLIQQTRSAQVGASQLGALQASWADIVRNGAPAPPIRRQQPQWTLNNLIQSIDDHFDELEQFAQRKIKSVTLRMHKEYLKFRVHHRPSDDMACTLMWESGASYSRYKWGVSGGFLSEQQKKQLGDTSQKYHSCGETDVLLRHPAAKFVFSITFNKTGYIEPCSRCEKVLNRKNIGYFVD